MYVTISRRPNSVMNWTRLDYSEWLGPSLECDDFAKWLLPVLWNVDQSVDLTISLTTLTELDWILRTAPPSLEYDLELGHSGKFCCFRSVTNHRKP